jgi:hypothetical protein
MLAADCRRHGCLLSHSALRDVPELERIQYDAGRDLLEGFGFGLLEATVVRHVLDALHEDRREDDGSAQVGSAQIRVVPVGQMQVVQRSESAQRNVFS